MLQTFFLFLKAINLRAVVKCEDVFHRLKVLMNKNELRFSLLVRLFGFRPCFVGLCRAGFVGVGWRDETCQVFSRLPHFPIIILSMAIGCSPVA
jgi:hypothetical protein